MYNTVVYTIFKNFIHHVKVWPSNLFEFAAFHCTVALPSLFYYGQTAHQRIFAIQDYWIL